MDQGQHQGQRQDQAAATMAVPELPEDWDQELVFPTGPIDWEQAVSQAAAIEE